MQNSPPESAQACVENGAKKKVYGSAHREKSPKQIATERDELATAITPYHSTLPTDMLELQLSDWLRNCSSRGHTLKSREMENFIAQKLIWFLRKHDYPVCGYVEIEEFLAYARESHIQLLGRWEANLKHSFKPLSRASLRSYYAYLTIIFNWLKSRKVIGVSPMEMLSARSIGKVNALLILLNRSISPLRPLKKLLTFAAISRFSCSPGMQEHVRRKFVILFWAI